MASESLTPPPSSGSPAKYLVLLLLLVGGGLGVYLAMGGKEEPKPAPAPEVKNAERPTALTNDTVQIPVEEEEEDAGEPVAEPETIKRPRPQGDVWECAGDIKGADAMRVINQNATAVRSCYERALRNNNQLQGTVKLSIRVGADGKVSHTRAGGNLREPEVLKCIQNLAKNWAFVAPRGASCAVIEMPYAFTPKN